MQWRQTDDPGPGELGFVYGVRGPRGGQAAGPSLWNPYLAPATRIGALSGPPVTGTPGTVAMPVYDVPLAVGARSELVATLQRILATLGLYSTAIDGLVGPWTISGTYQAFDFLRRSPAPEIPQIVGTGPQGMTVGQIVATLNRGLAAHASVTAARETPPETRRPPDEPDEQIDMTPADAARLERELGLSGGTPWGWIAAGAAAVGAAIWFATRKRSR